jgi:hypothetical protein
MEESGRGLLLSQHLHEETEENYKNLGLVSRIPVRDLHQGPLESKEGVLTTRQ